MTVVATEEIAKVVEISDEKILHKIRSQIEFYFKNYSLSHDKYMQNELKENDKKFPVENFLKFNKIKQLLPTEAALTCDNLVKAIKASSVLNLSDDLTKVSRTDDIPDSWADYLKEAEERTVYLKGFAQDASLESITENLCQALDSSKIEGIFLRKTPKKQFKGSIYVTLADAESAKTLLESDKVSLTRTEEFPALRMMKTEHVAKQSEKNNKVKKDKLSKQIPKNSVLKITNLACDSNERFEVKKLRQAFEKIHPCDFVDQTVEGDALVIYTRFKGENSVSRFLEILGKLPQAEGEEVDERLAALHAQFDGKEKFEQLSMTALEGEAELEYWSKIKELMKQKFNNKSNKKNYSMKKFKKKGSQPDAKKAKTE